MKMAKTDDAVKTVCPYCGVGCGVLASPRPDGTCAISGDPEHPANFGRLCSKGSALGETLDLEGRLLYPEAGGRRVSWDEALDLVAHRFAAAIEEHGPDSVAFYVSGQILTEDYYVANKLMKGFIGSANIDTNSRLCMASSVAGHRRAFGTDTVPGTYEDLELSDLVVLVGSNLAWCHPVLYQRIAAAKEARPHMKVVLVDPRRTMTADLADLHLPIRPDGDVALFNGLLAYLARNSVLDRAYIEAHTSGFEEALSAASSLSDDDLHAQTGLDRQTLLDFYRLAASTEKTVTIYSQGVNQSACGTDKVNAIVNCHLATGRIGRPGMGPFSVTGQPNAMGGREVGGLANMLAAHMDIENPRDREKVQRFWNAPKIAGKPGLKAVDLFEAAAGGRIKALWIVATNPVVSMPDADRVEAAIKACPFVVVSDVTDETDTARHADVKLPSLAWGEKDGTVTNSERRISRQRAFLPPPGEARADWQQFAEVGRRMGFEAAFGWPDAASVFREFSALSAFENQDSRSFDIGAHSGITCADYDRLSPFQWPQKAGEEPRKTRFFANGGFYTPDRKARFIAAKSHAQPQLSPDCYVLNTGRIRDQWHTMTRTGKSARLSAHLAEPFVEIHPDDARACGIEEAELVKIGNDRGAVLARALILPRQKKGNVFMPIHWSDRFSAHARIGRLVPPATDAFSGQPALKAAHVHMERFDAVHYGFILSRTKPALGEAAYWALARARGGWRAEFALDRRVEDIERFAEKLVGARLPENGVSLEDPVNGEQRYGWFDGETLLCALFLSARPVELSRSLVADALIQRFDGWRMRQQLLAARPFKGEIDKGAIVCSCLNVGANEIAAAGSAGCRSVADVGEKTGAGTNCGSCRGEIAAILYARVAEAAE